MARYSRRAFIGQRGELLAARPIVIPCRKGSVLEALMLILAMLCSRDKSSYNKVDCGSYLVLCVDVYSDTLRKPKNAVVMAAQNISLSSYMMDELNKFSRMLWRIVGVMGLLFGSENFFPSVLFIPLSSRYRRWKDLKSTWCPCVMVECLTAAM